MSFILDALRKSDHRRRMDKAPDLQTSHGSMTSRRRRGRGWFAIGLTLLLIAAVGIAVFSQRERLQHHWQAWLGNDGQQTERPDAPDPVLVGAENETTGEAGVDRTAMLDQQGRDRPRERVVTDSEQARAEIERLLAERREGDTRFPEPAETTSATPSDRRAPTNPRPSSSAVRQAPDRPHVQTPDPAEAERIQQQLLEAQRRREAGQPDQAPGSEKSDLVEAEAVRPGAETPWAPQASEYVRAWELPLSIRRNMPALRLSIHVFAERAEDRFVLINGERFVTGDELIEGARLVDIRREGAVVDYRDYRFLLEP